MSEFDTSIIGGKVPRNRFKGNFVIMIPTREFMVEEVNIWNAATQTLSTQDADLDFRNVKPTAVFGRVVYFQSLGQCASMSGRKRFIQGRDNVGVEVIHYQ